MKLSIHGAAGRMGRAIACLAAQADDIQIVGAVGSANSPLLGKDLGEIAGIGSLGVALSPDLPSALLGADVVIDFSTAGAVNGLVHAALKAGVGIVSGTTRLNDTSQERLKQAGKQVATLWAPNMSLGVQLLGDLVETAIRGLGSDYDIEIVEAHHHHKTDAPSGTARQLLERAQAARANLTPMHGREGQIGARKGSEIGMHAIRGGGIIGDHSVHLIGNHDRIEITHRALHRDLFAAGALRAARFIATQAPGYYSMKHILETA